MPGQAKSISAASSAGGRARSPPPTRAQPPESTQQQQQQQQRQRPASRSSHKLLDYIVAIDDAKAVVDRLRRMRRGGWHSYTRDPPCSSLAALTPDQHTVVCTPYANAPTLPPPKTRPGPSLHLPTEASGCLRVWEVLSGSVQQRRVWTFGREAAAPDDAGVNFTANAAAAAPAGAAAVSSSEPLSIRSGIVFTSCAAGRAHGAAADATGHVFTWGSNSRGQCGVQQGAQPIAIHALPSPPAAAADGAAGSSMQGGQSGGGGGRRLTKLDSLALLESSVRLPASLLLSLKAEQAKRQLTGAASSPQGAAASAVSADAAAAEAGRQLHVYRLTIGQALHMVACGGVSHACNCLHHLVTTAFHLHCASSGFLALDRKRPSRKCTHPATPKHFDQAHTLASLQSGGLMAWGDNSKGQCGLPAGAFPVVPAPSRVHAFDGARLIHISAGLKHSAVVQEGGVLCTFGHGRCALSAGLAGFWTRPSRESST
jgi:hypothetical protein